MSQSRTYRVGFLGGDGIGPEVAEEGRKVVNAVAGLAGFAIEWTDYPYGAEHSLRVGGEIMPASVLDEMRKLDALLLGAIGDPRFRTGELERAIVGQIRFGLDLYVNLRPVKLFDAALCPLKGKGPADIDFVVVRENTEDLYTGMGGFFKKGTVDEVAIQEMILTRRGAERIFRYAYQVAANRGKKLLLVDKANAVQAFDLYRRAFEEIGRSEFPEIEREVALADAAAMWMIKNPEWFDTVVTSNLFGDILTDLGAMLQGGMGLAASGNIHPGRVSMFEPIHGSAPKYAGQGVANPIAAILAGGMLLSQIGEPEAGRAIEEAVATALREGEIPAGRADASGWSTARVGDRIAERVHHHLTPR